MAISFKRIKDVDNGYHVAVYDNDVMVRFYCGLMKSHVKDVVRLVRLKGYEADLGNKYCLNEINGSDCNPNHMNSDGVYLDENGEIISIVRGNWKQFANCDEGMSVEYNQSRFEYI